MSKGLRVAIVGATGAVGGELIRLLEERRFPVSELRLLASERSSGKQLCFRGEKLPVQVADESFVKGFGLNFFSAGASTAKRLAPGIVESGATVIDNSSAFRMDAGVPLIVPEINADEIKRGQKLFPVANCTAIILCMAVAPLRGLGKINRLVVSTYQSASGAGARAMKELEDQTRDVLSGGTPKPNVFPHACAFNLFSHNTPINDEGYNQEEWKVIHESQKILGMPDLAVGITCVRVPVLRAHSEAITVEFEGRAPSVDEVLNSFRGAKGIRLVDDREKNIFPMPLDASGKEEVLVGRIRKDISHPSAIALFASGDQLLKGAALNGIQIAEELLKRGMIE